MEATGGTTGLHVEEAEQLRAFNTGLSADKLTLLVDILEAGDLDTKPHIPKYDAKQLNKRLKQLYGSKFAPCEKQFSDKQSAKLWACPKTAQQPKICQHTQTLQYKGQFIIPAAEWFPVTQHAYDLAESQLSDSQAVSTAQRATRTTAMLQQHNIAVDARHHGISSSYVSRYVMLRQQQHKDITSEPVNSQTLPTVRLPKLSAHEADVLFIYEPAVEATGAPTLILGKRPISMVPDPIPDAASQKQRFVAVVRLPRFLMVNYEYDTGMLKVGAYHLQQQAVINACMLVSGNPEDVISRPRQLYLRHERYFVTDAGGQSTSKTTDLFDNQAIVKSSVSRLKAVQTVSLTVDNSDSDEEAVAEAEKENAAVFARAADSKQGNVQQQQQSDIQVPAAPTRSTQGSSVQPITEFHPASAIPNRLLQLQEQYQFAFASHSHRQCFQADGTVSLTYYCNRGPKSEQTIIRQYLPWDDKAQQHSTTCGKQCGCQCHVVLSYFNNSLPDRCLVTGTVWKADSRMHAAWQKQQQQQLPPQQQCDQQQHEQQELSSAGEPVVKLVMYTLHSGHTPGTADSRKYLPVDEAGHTALQSKMATDAMSRRLHHDTFQAQCASLAPPVDDDIVSGSYRDGVGLQQSHKRQQQDAPQSKSKRLIRAMTKEDDNSATM